MCETKAVVASISIYLLVVASFRICQVHTYNKVGHHSKTKSQGPFENEHKEYCWNAGECYYLVDKAIVHGYMEHTDVNSKNGGTRLNFKIENGGKISI